MANFVVALLLCLGLVLGACAEGPAADNGGDAGPPSVEQSPVDVTPPDASGSGGEPASPDDEGRADSEFFLDEIQVGDTVAGMRVESIDAAHDPDSQGRDPQNVVIGFSGRKTVTGRYTFHPPEDEFLANAVCMHMGDSIDADLPKMVEDQRYTWFCFHNEDEAQAAFREPGAGTATVVINDYTIISYPSEVWNTATLVEAQSVDGRPLVKEITTYPEGMERRGDFRLTNIFWLPVTTYMPVDWHMEGLQVENAVGMLLMPGASDVGIVEIMVFDDWVTREDAEAIAKDRLGQEGFNDIKAGDAPSWALSIYDAEDRIDRDPSDWRAARLYLGRHGDRYFYALDQLNRIEAGDGWGPVVEVILDEWWWTNTGEPLGG